MTALTRFVDEAVEHQSQLIDAHCYELKTRQSQSPLRTEGKIGEAIPKPPLIKEVLENTSWKQAYAAALREHPEIAHRIEGLADALRRVVQAVCEAAHKRRRLNCLENAKALMDFSFEYNKLTPYLPIEYTSHLEIEAEEAYYATDAELQGEDE